MDDNNGYRSETKTKRNWRTRSSWWKSDWQMSIAIATGQCSSQHPVKHETECLRKAQIMACTITGRSENYKNKKKLKTERLPITRIYKSTTVYIHTNPRMIFALQVAGFRWANPRNNGIQVTTTRREAGILIHPIKNVSVHWSGENRSNLQLFYTVHGISHWWPTVVEIISLSLSKRSKFELARNDC